MLAHEGLVGALAAFLRDPVVDERRAVLGGVSPQFVRDMIRDTVAPALAHVFGGLPLAHPAWAAAAAVVRATLAGGQWDELLPAFRLVKVLANAHPPCVEVLMPALMEAVYANEPFLLPFEAAMEHLLLLGRGAPAVRDWFGAHPGALARGIAWWDAVVTLNLQLPKLGDAPANRVCLPLRKLLLDKPEALAGRRLISPADYAAAVAKVAVGGTAPAAFDKPADPAKGVKQGAGLQKKAHPTHDGLPASGSKHGPDGYSYVSMLTRWALKVLAEGLQPPQIRFDADENVDAMRNRAGLMWMGAKKVGSPLNYGGFRVANEAGVGLKAAALVDWENDSTIAGAQYAVHSPGFGALHPKARIFWSGTNAPGSTMVEGWEWQETLGVHCSYEFFLVPTAEEKAALEEFVRRSRAAGEDYVLLGPGWLAREGSIPGAAENAYFDPDFQDSSVVNKFNFVRGQFQAGFTYQPHAPAAAAAEDPALEESCYESVPSEPAAAVPALPLHSSTFTNNVDDGPTQNTPELDTVHEGKDGDNSSEDADAGVDDEGADFNGDDDDEDDDPDFRRALAASMVPQQPPGEEKEEEEEGS
jgi:hypothetical protein